MHNTIKTIVFLMVASNALSQISYASTMVYQGQNPAVFPGANPGNSAPLLASTNRPKDPSIAANAAAGQLSPASVVEQSVLGQISSKIYSQIFNTSNASGSFDLGGGNLISYIRTGGNLIITEIDPVHGKTVITLPDL